MKAKHRPPTVAITWAKRAKVTTTDVARLRRWAAVGLPYAVVHVKSLLGLPGRWLAVERAENGNEAIVGRGKTRAAAEKHITDLLRKRS